MSEIRTTLTQPELYCRTNLTQSAKGDWRSDTTVSVRAEAPIEEVMDLMRELMWSADSVVQEEIERREQHTERSGHTDDSAVRTVGADQREQGV